MMIATMGAYAQEEKRKRGKEEKRERGKEGKREREKEVEAEAVVTRESIRRRMRRRWRRLPLCLLASQ